MNWKFWKRRSRKDLEESVSILSADLATATVKAETLEKENGSLSEDLRGSRAVVGNLIEEVRRLESSLLHCESKIGEQAKSIAQEQLEAERARAELAKTEAQLERAELHLQTQKGKMDELQKQMSATLEWIKETHHLNVPMANTPIRKLLSTLTSKRNSLVAALLLLPSLLFAQFPVNTPYGKAWSQTNVLSLANSNATSKPLTNRHINGVTTLYGLEQGSNAVLFMNGSNIVINGTGSGSGSPLLVSNVTLVSKNGNDGTGVPGNLDFPFLTISNAVQASPSGFRVAVAPGIYAESVMLKDRVDIVTPSGATILQAANLPVLLDGGNAVTCRISGSLYIQQINTGGASDGIRLTSADSMVTVEDAIVDTSSTSGIGLNIQQGSIHYKGFVYASGRGLSWQGSGNSTINATVFSTNDYAALIGSSGSNYVTGNYFSALNSSIHCSSGNVFVENAYAFTSDNDFGWALEHSGGAVQARRCTLVSQKRHAIGKYGGTLMVLDACDLSAGTNTATLYTIDNDGQANHGTIEIHVPCFGNKPPNPAMNILCGSLIVSNATVWKNEQYFKSVHNLTNIITRTNGIVAFPSTPASGSWAALDTIGNLFRTNLPASITNLSGNPNVATNILGAGFVTVSSNNAGTWTITGVASGETNFNGEVSVTNSTRIGLVNGKSSNTNLLRSVQSGNGIVLTNEGTNVMFAIDPAVVASQANLTAASNTLNTAIVAATNSASVTNWINFRQPATESLTNLSGNPNVATNIIGAGTVTVTSNNLGEWTITGSGGSALFNANQFLPSATHTNIRAGALLTNIVIQQSNNTSVSLVVSNNPGSTRNLIEAYTTNQNGFVVRSNGAFEIKGNVTGANPTLLLHNDGANQTYMIWTNSNGVGSGAAIMRCDNAGNATFGPGGSGFGKLFLNFDGGTGGIDFGVPTVGTPLAFVPDTATYIIQGGTVRRLVLTNVWDIQGRTNLWLGRTGLLDGIVLTNDIRFLGHNSTSNTVWTCTNSTTGEGEWRTAPAATLTTNANQFGAQSLLTIKEGAFLTNIMAWPSNVTGPSLIVNSKPGIGTNLFEVRNTNDNPVIFASTNGGITLVSSNSLVLGTQTNASSENITGGVTNWAGTELKGTAFASSNMLVKVGQSVSNAWVGGTMVWDLNNYTNLNGNVATFSNLANCTIPAHALTNNGDMIRAYWGGVAATAMQNTQNFQIVLGSTTLLDTGLQIGSNYLYRAYVEITRTGNNSQHVDAKLEWLPNALGLTGLGFASTNEMFETLVETNGINTVLALKASARRVGALTNTQFRVYYDPAVR